MKERSCAAREPFNERLIAERLYRCTDRRRAVRSQIADAMEPRGYWTG